MRKVSGENLVSGLFFQNAETRLFSYGDSSRNRTCNPRLRRTIHGFSASFEEVNEITATSILSWVCGHSRSLTESYQVGRKRKLSGEYLVNFCGREWPAKVRSPDPFLSPL